MGWGKYIWHIQHAEGRSTIEAAYIHGLLSWVSLQTGEQYKTILDVPCGNGRLHPYLEKLGYDVEGIDLSEELVEEARQKGRKCWVANGRPEGIPSQGI